MNIKKLIKNASSREIYITSHTNPDGDAVGACAAFAYFVESLGKTPIVLLEDIADEALNGVVPQKFRGVDDGTAPELIFALDTGDVKRLSINESIFRRAKFSVNIDHHMSNDCFASANIVKFDYSSTCELLYITMCEYNVVITPEIAAALYVGLITDTGGFRHLNTTPRTHLIAAELLKSGINAAEIYQRHITRKTRAGLAIFSKALSGAKYIADGRIAYTKATLNDYISAGANHSETDAVANTLLDVDGVETSVFFYEKNGSVKASFRSKRFNVGTFAARFGGGGHELAAGAAFSGLTIDGVIELVLRELSECIKEY